MKLEARIMRLEDNAATSWAALAGLTALAVLRLGSLGVFFIHHFLRLDCHMHDIGMISTEFRVWSFD